MSIDWIKRAEALNPQVRDLIGGRWSSPGGEVLEKRGPRDGSILCRFGAGEARTAEEAVAAARRSFEDGRWCKLPVSRRKDVLYKLASLIEAHSEELALLECLDAGKPISAALSLDVPASAQTMRSYAELADQAHGKLYGINSVNISYQLRRPWGVVAGIVGWNFPLLLAASKIAPALATGNSLVLKPSELTSLSASRLAELALEAGLPEGVLNVIHGDHRLGAALALHPDVNLLTFTGSSQTGKKLLAASGQSNMKRLLLECGGKAPSIIFDDSPRLEGVVEAVAARAFWNQGQVCTASSRVLIQESIKEVFLPQLIERVACLSPGDPLEAGTIFGALVGAEHRQKVLGYIEAGEREGARKIYQSNANAPIESGFYVPPVIFDQVSSKHRIAQEEIFGPVLSVLTFRDEQDALRIANDTMYGLSAIVWTKDLGRAHRMTHGLEAGWITVNATDTPGTANGVVPSGGLRQSGIGVEGGLDGLEEYMSRSSVQWYV